MVWGKLLYREKYSDGEVLVMNGSSQISVVPFLVVLPVKVVMRLVEMLCRRRQWVPIVDTQYCLS